MATAYIVNFWYLNNMQHLHIGTYESVEHTTIMLLMIWFMVINNLNNMISQPSRMVEGHVVVFIYQSHTELIRFN